MEFFGTFWALVPPLVAIVLALITKETYTSLFVGIVVGALLLAGFNPVDTLNYVVGATVGEGDEAVSVGFISALADPWNAGIFMFLVILGILVALINAAGGSAHVRRATLGAPRLYHACLLKACRRCHYGDLAAGVQDASTIL